MNERLTQFDCFRPNKFSLSAEIRYNFLLNLLNFLNMLHDFGRFQSSQSFFEARVCGIVNIPLNGKFKLEKETEGSASLFIHDLMH